MAFGELTIVRWLLAARVFTYHAHAQYPPPVTGVYQIQSPLDPEIVVSYKTPNSTICHTTKETQKQYSGYVHLPQGLLTPIKQNYPINTFFWFIEARDDPANAPLTIWLNGGPGSSSQIGMWQELGPCEVVPADDNHLKSIPREYGWDRASNMLFIDQPNQVGFSYDTPTNGVLPLLDINNSFIPNVSAPANGGGYIRVDPQDNKAIRDAMKKTHLLDGTFSSGNQDFTANTTDIAAAATWNFLQAWFTNFPQYYPRSKGLQFMAESYGGKYGPTFSAYIEEQNFRISQGHLPRALEIHLESVGIINGCIDDLVQEPYYPIYAHTNPYAIEAIDAKTRDKALYDYYKPNGCRDRLVECRRLQQLGDPDSVGDNPLVNLTCRRANEYCGTTQMNSYFKAKRGVYDITHKDPDPFPPSYYLEYLNNATVQQAIGVPVNFTQSSRYVYKAFAETGDMARGGELDDISYLLNRGIRVALIYGDRDFICNYMGGEAVSLAVKHKYSKQFAESGYTDVHVNSTYIGGQVRQFGNFSFTRVYQAGHLVPAYQPETAFRIFERFIKGKSIADGKYDAENGNKVYQSQGPKKSQIALIPPPSPPPMCFLRAITSCTKKQFSLIASGQGIIMNGVLYNSTEYVRSDDHDAGLMGTLGRYTGGEETRQTHDDTEEDINEGVEPNTAEMPAAGEIMNPDHHNDSPIQDLSEDTSVLEEMILESRQTDDSFIQSDETGSYVDIEEKSEGFSEQLYSPSMAKEPIENGGSEGSNSPIIAIDGIEPFSVSGTILEVEPDATTEEERWEFEDDIEEHFYLLTYRRDPTPAPLQTINMARIGWDGKIYYEDVLVSLDKK